MAVLQNALLVAAAVAGAHGAAMLRSVNLVPNTTATVAVGSATMQAPFRQATPYMEVASGNVTVTSGNSKTNATLDDDKYYTAITSLGGQPGVTIINVTADPLRTPEVSDRNDYNMWDTPDYGFKTAKVQIYNAVPGVNLSVTTRNLLCDRCAFSQVAYLPTGSATTKGFTTYYDNEIRYGVQPEDADPIYSPVETFTFEEKREYSLFIYATGTGMSTFVVTDVDQSNEYIPLLIWFGILTGASIGWYWLVKPIVWRKVLRPVYKSYRAWIDKSEAEADIATPSGEVMDKKTTDTLHTTSNNIAEGAVVNVDTQGGTASQNPAPTAAGKLKARLRSLDSFRGFDLMLMIFVNGGGGGYWFFDHATWDGLLVADVVFPWFMFMMGVSMALSLAKQGLGKPGANKRKMIAGIAWRAFKIWLWGQFLTDANFNNLPNYRVPGVLQRFAFANFFCGITMVLTHDLQAAIAGPKEAGDTESPAMAVLGDIRRNCVQFVASFGYMALFLILTYALPVPGCPTGYTGPAGLHLDGAYPKECTGGAALHIDKALFQYEHLYRWPTCRGVYQVERYDPEGFLGSISSIFSVYMGYHGGRMIVNYKSHWKRVALWVMYGAIFSLIGGGLAGFKQFGGPIPLNKNLWSLSYVLLMGGTAGLMLALFYVVIDIFKVWSGTPFIYPGMNSIAVYSIGQIFQFYFPFSFAIWNNYDTTFNSHMMMLTNNLMNVYVVLLISTVWYHKRWFYTM